MRKVAGTGANKVIFLTNVKGLILDGSLVTHMTLEERPIQLSRKLDSEWKKSICMHRSS